ncbi:MAG: hypothetical protein AB7V46_11510 [Thermomicrobiales bacterium]
MTDAEPQPETPVPTDQMSGDAAGFGDSDSTVGVGSVFAIGCSLIVLVIMLGGVCYFIARQVG